MIIVGLDHEVVCYDSLITGYRKHKHFTGKDGFRFIEGDIRDVVLLKVCRMHPCSLSSSFGFGPRSTKTFTNQ